MPVKSGAEMCQLFVQFSCLNLAHWVVSYAYLKVTIEMNAMLDVRVHLNNQHTIAEVERQKDKLKVASIFAIVMCFICGLLWVIADAF